MTWREPRRVLELARVVVAPRDGYPAAGPEFLARHLPDLADRATFLDGPRLRLSASELRRRAASGRSLRYLVPDAVAAYIGDHGLYRNQRRTPSIVTEPVPAELATAPRADGLPKRAASKPRQPASARRSSSPAGSSSWPRTRRPPTSSCSTSPG